MMETSFMTTREVAQLLRVTTRSVRRMAQSGRLRAYQRGTHGGLLFLESDVRQLIRPTDGDDRMLLAIGQPY